MIHQFISAEPKRNRSLPNLSKEAKQEFIAILSINSLFVLKMNNTVNWDRTMDKLWAEYTTNSAKYPNIDKFLVMCSNDATIFFSPRQVFGRKMYNVFSASKKRPKMGQIATAAVNSAAGAAATMTGQIATAAVNSATAAAMPPPAPRKKKKNTKNCPDCNALYGNAKQKCNQCGHDFRKDPKSAAAQRGAQQRARRKAMQVPSTSSASSSARAPPGGLFTDSDTDSDSDDDDTHDIWIQICRVASKSNEFYINISNYLKDKKSVSNWPWQINFSSSRPNSYVINAFVQWVNISGLTQRHLRTCIQNVQSNVMGTRVKFKSAEEIKTSIVDVLDKYQLIWTPQLKPPGILKPLSVPSGRGGASSSSSGGGASKSASSSSFSSRSSSSGASSSRSSSSGAGASSVPSGGGIKLPITPTTAKQYFKAALWNYFVYILQQGELGGGMARTRALNARENLSKSRKNWKNFEKFVLWGIRTYDIPISTLRKDVTKTLTLYSKIDPFISIIQDIRKNHQLTNHWINHPIMIEFKKAIEWALKNNYRLPPLLNSAPPPPSASQRQPCWPSCGSAGGASKQSGGPPSQSSQQASVPAKAITLDLYQYNALKLAIDKHITSKDPAVLMLTTNNMAYFQVLFRDKEFQKDSNLPADILNHPKFVDYIYNLAVKHMYTFWLWKDDDNSFKIVDKGNSMIINEKNIHSTDARITLPNNHQVTIIYCNEDEAIQDGSSWYRYFCRKTLNKRYAGGNVSAPGHNADLNVQKRQIQAAKVAYGMIKASLTGSSSSSSSGGGASSSFSGGGASKSAGASKTVDTSCPTTFTGSTTVTSHLISEYTPLNTTINVWITTPDTLSGQYVYSGFVDNKPMWIGSITLAAVYIVYHNGRYIIAAGGQILYECVKLFKPNEPVLSNVGWKRTQSPMAASMEEDIIVYYENLSGDGPCSINDLYVQTCNNPSSNMPVWGDVNQADLIQFRKQHTKYDWSLGSQRVSSRNARVPRLISRRMYNKINTYRQWIGDSQGFPTTARGPSGPKIAGTWSWELPKVLREGIPPDDWFTNVDDKKLYSANLGSAAQEFFDRYRDRHSFVGFFQPDKIKTTSCGFIGPDGNYQCGITPKAFFGGMMHRLKREKELNGISNPRMSIIYHATKSEDIYKKIVLGDFKMMADAATARLYGNGVYAAIHPYINYCIGGVANNKVTYASGLGPNNNYYVVIVANAVSRPSYYTNRGTWVQPDSRNFFTGGSVDDNGFDSSGNSVRPLPLSLDNREVVFFQDSASNWSHIIGLAVFAIN